MRLRAHLNGAGEPPEEWVVSAVCEAFSCLPSQALRELETADADLVFTILDLRAYARAKAEVDAAQKQSDLKMTPAIVRVFQIEADALKADQ